MQEARLNFRPLFKPKTVAVIGVSQKNERHPANVIFNKAFLRSPVEVFPVNPRGGVLQGEKVFRRISDIPRKIDLAVGFFVCCCLCKASNDFIPDF